jgi:hypothetical protein
VYSVGIPRIHAIALAEDGKMVANLKTMTGFRLHFCPGDVQTTVPRDGESIIVAAMAEFVENIRNSSSGSNSSSASNSSTTSNSTSN